MTSFPPTGERLLKRANRDLEAPPKWELEPFLVFVADTDERSPVFKGGFSLAHPFERIRGLIGRAMDLPL